MQGGLVPAGISDGLSVLDVVSCALCLKVCVCTGEKA
jgi:hypothetical protein